MQNGGAGWEVRMRVRRTPVPPFAIPHNPDPTAGLPILWLYQDGGELPVSNRYSRGRLWRHRHPGLLRRGDIDWHCRRGRKHPAGTEFGAPDV